MESMFRANHRRLRKIRSIMTSVKGNQIRPSGLIESGLVLYGLVCSGGTVACGLELRVNPY